MRVSLVENFLITGWAYNYTESCFSVVRVCKPWQLSDNNKCIGYRLGGGLCAYSRAFVTKISPVPWSIPSFSVIPGSNFKATFKKSWAPGVLFCEYTR